MPGRWTVDERCLKGYHDARNNPAKDAILELIWFCYVCQQHRHKPFWYWYYLGKAAGYAKQLVDEKGRDEARRSVQEYLETACAPEFAREVRCYVAALC